MPYKPSNKVLNTYINSQDKKAKREMQMRRVIGAACGILFCYIVLIVFQAPGSKNMPNVNLSSEDAFNSDAHKYIGDKGVKQSYSIPASMPTTIEAINQLTEENASNIYAEMKKSNSQGKSKPIILKFPTKRLSDKEKLIVMLKEINTYKIHNIVYTYKGIAFNQKPHTDSGYNSA